VRLLGIDTVGSAGGVALWEPDRSPLVRELGERRAHAEHLLPSLEALLAERDLGWSDIDRVAVNVGPGSFTGIRIGLAAALGLAGAGGPEPVGIGCLDILARACYDATPPRMGGYIVSVTDVRRGEVVLQRFRVETGGPVREGPERLVPVIDAGKVPPPGSVLAGDGAELPWADASGLDRWVPTGPERAVAAARLGADAEGPASRSSLVPRYAREADARPRRR
jgi:tRNA threonylcarbamoyl adenosine modification protein YeaZ